MKRKPKKTKKVRTPTPLCVSLEPGKFIVAWNHAMTLAESENVTPIAVARAGITDDDGSQLKLTNNPLVRLLAGVCAEFPDQKEQVSCSVRFLGIMALVAQGDLGPFFHETHGIWNPALEVLAVARCDVKDGFDRADVRERLSKLDVPSV